MTMTLKRAERRQVKLKLGLAGPSGSGKTYSALLLAKGLVGNWEKVAVIDTENGSADLYSHLGPYSTLTMEPPFTSEKYVKAIHECVKAGMEAVVVDSMTHVWSGQGGILDYKEALGGRFQDWKKATPLHQDVLDAILQSPVHVICCTRVKTEWAIEQNEKGKAAPVKMGLKLDQRDGFEYELTVAWRIGATHMASSDKDRTGLFAGKPDFKISEATGKVLKEWADSGKPAAPAAADLYDDTIPAAQKGLASVLKRQSVPESQWEAIGKALHGRPKTELEMAILEVQGRI